MIAIMCLAVLLVWEFYIRKKGKYIKITFVAACGFLGVFAFVKAWQVFPLLALFGVVMGLIKNCGGSWIDILKTGKERKTDKEDQILSLIVWIGCLECMAYLVIFHKEIKPDFLILSTIIDFIGVLQNIIAAIIVVLFGIGIIYIGVKDYKFYKNFPINPNDKQYPAVIQRYVRKKKKYAALVLKVGVEELLLKNHIPSGALIKETRKEERILDKFKYYEYITHARYEFIKNPIGTVFRLSLRYSAEIRAMYIIEEIAYDKHKAVKTVVAGIMIILLGVFLGTEAFFYK